MLERIRRQLDRLEESMGARDVPVPRIVLMFVEAHDGAPTGQVTVVEPGQPERVEWHDPAEIRSSRG